MVGARRLLTVTLTWLLMSAKSSLVCADGDVTEETPDSSRSVNTSGIIHSRDSDEADNGTTLRCPCDLNQCKWFCCPRGYSHLMGTNDCLEDTLTPRALSVERSIKDYRIQPFIMYTCGFGFHSRSYTPIPHSQDGSICRMKFPGYPHSMDDCLYRELNTNNYGILRCIQFSNPTVMENIDGRRNTERSVDVLFFGWIFACMASASLVALGTFIVYCVVPELKNFQGWITRSYLASYFSCMMFMTSLFFPSQSLQTSLLLHVPILIYFGLACLLWLNVMSFDIWRKFRKIRSSPTVNAKDRQRATFIRYSMYAWGLPVLPALLVAIVWTSNELAWAEESLLLVPLPILGMFICNTYFYTSTALKIKQCNKETAQMVDDVNKHHQKNKQWFNLYLKLFIVMGCPIILWTVVFTVKSRIFMMVIVPVEPLQAICIFYMFVWKDDVRRSIRKQFVGMTRKLGCCHQCDSTSGIRNGIEEL